MKWTKAVKKQIEEYEPYLEIIEKGGKIETNYGLECIALTDEHIKAIKEGKAINFGINADEYEGLIFYRENKE